MPTSMPTVTTITPTTTAVATVHSTAVDDTFNIAHTASTGAFIRSCKPTAIKVCICTTSLVVRVIRLDDPNLFISAAENEVTLSSIAFRKVLEKFAAVCAAKNPHTTEHAALPNAYNSINPPLRHTTPIVILSPTTSFISRCVYSGIVMSQ